MGVQKKLVNITCKDYCKSHNYKYFTIEEVEQQKVYIPNYTVEFIEPSYQLYSFPEKYVSELLNVKIIGGNGIIFDEENNCIYDLALSEDEHRYNLVFNSVYYVDKYSTFVGYEETGEVIEEAIMLAGVVSRNYYHFNFESLSKLCLINTMSQYDNVPILVDEIVLRIPQLHEELMMINKNKRKIYFLKSRHSYNIKKLIYISDLIIIPLNIKDPYKPEYKDLVISDLAANLIHNNLAITNTPKRRIYISRKNSWNPRLSNTDEIEKIFIEFGYELVYPEGMSFLNQLILFSEAEYIAGASGAGFTNMIFANKKATMICIVPKEYQVPCFSNVCGILGQKYYYLDASYGHSIKDQANNTIYENRFVMDAKVVRELLENIHSK